jgi:hypothetical protein
MLSLVATDEDDFRSREEVERRREPRGVFEGLKIDILTPYPASFDAVEASRRGFFVREDDPEKYTLGDIHEVRVSLRGKSITCRMEVFRKEIEPRRGVALRIAFIDPKNEEALKALLGPGVGSEDRWE